jgi:hypothetical protein
MGYSGGAKRLTYGELRHGSYAFGKFYVNGGYRARTCNLTGVIHPIPIPANERWSLVFPHDIANRRPCKHSHLIALFSRVTRHAAAEVGKNSMPSRSLRRRQTGNLPAAYDLGLNIVMVRNNVRQVARFPELRATQDHCSECGTVPPKKGVRCTNNTPPATARDSTASAG